MKDKPLPKTRPGKPREPLEVLKDKTFWRKFGEKMDQIDEELARKRKDKAVTLRLNSFDLAKIKEKAAARGMKYQTFISRVLHQVASKD